MPSAVVLDMIMKMMRNNRIGRGSSVFFPLAGRIVSSSTMLAVVGSAVVIQPTTCTNAYYSRVISNDDDDG